MVTVAASIVSRALRLLDREPGQTEREDVGGDATGVGQQRQRVRQTPRPAPRSGAAGPGAVGSTAAAGLPERRGRALLGWIDEPDVRPAFHATTVTSPTNVEDFVAAWRARRAGKPATSLALSGPQYSKGLPTPLAERASTLRATEQFRTVYQPFGAEFASVKLADLISPQWWVDTAYVDGLAADAPDEGDLGAQFDFSFAMGRLARPMLMGTNGAAFVSARRDLGALTPLRVTNHSPGKVAFEFDVIPRPNWIWLAAVNGMTRLVIINGTHHLLALLKAGRKEALCLIRTAQSLQEFPAMGVNYQDPSLFKPSEVMSPRPPLLRDYLDDGIVTPVSVRAVDQYMRLAVQHEIGVVPRGE